MGSISEFIERNYRHFNAAVLKDAADAYIAHLDRGGKMMVTLAGAMSTAELGVSLAEMIRRDKVHAIACTGANMEEDLFNLVAHSKYERIPNYRELTPQQGRSCCNGISIASLTLAFRKRRRCDGSSVQCSTNGSLPQRANSESFLTSSFTIFCANAGSNGFTRSTLPIVG